MQDLQADLGQLLALVVLFCLEEVLGQILEAKRVAWVRSKRLLEEAACLLATFVVCDVRGDLDYAESSQRHRVVWVILDGPVHAELCLRQVAKPEVAKSDREPDVGRRSWVVPNHGLQLRQTLLDMAFVKLDNRSGQAAQCLDRGVGGGLPSLLVETLARLNLLFTCVAVAQRLFELACRNLVEAHAYKVVRVNLRDGVRLFDQLEASLAVQLAL